jgi:hypothetical protein
MAYVLTGFPAIALFAATALAVWRTAILPRWYVGVTTLAAIWYLIGGASYATGDGFFAPDGGWVQIGFFAFLVWTALTGVLLIQRLAAGAPQPATAM